MPEPGPTGPPTRTSSERLGVLATVGGVVVIVVVVVLANVLSRSGGSDGAGGPGGDGASGAVTPVASASADRTDAAALATMDPGDVAQDAIGDRGAVAEQQAVPSGAASLRGAVESLAAVSPYSFTITTLNILGSQHTAPGGGTPGFASGPVRTRWAADLIASYGSSIVGLQELQSDQLAAMATATGGRFDFWPGTTLGGKGVPQNLMWDNTVWTATYTGSITVPFMGGTRPQPIVRLQNIASGREIYVLNVHNSPRDRLGREDERDQATAIEVAAVNQLRQDGIPVLILGDFNEHEEIFCTMTSQTDLLAANGGSNSGVCRPPSPMRVDWIFGSGDVAMSGFRLDTGPAVRRITDHAVLTTTVSVP